MAALPNAGVDGFDGAVRAAETRVWRPTLGVGLALCLAYALIPSSRIVLRDLGIYTTVELAAILAILLGLRWTRPAAAGAWLLIAAGLTLWTCGDVLWTVYTLLGRDPFPSAADLFYLAGYPFLAVGLMGLSRRVGPRDDSVTTLDVAIITVGFSLIVAG